MESNGAIEHVQNRIHLIRGQRVMLDFDLATLYGIESKALKRSVKRNVIRFPADFMFEITSEEWANLRYQIGTSSLINDESASKNRHGGRRYLPYAFTEQGVAMLSGILNSDKAIAMNIAIMRAFVELRRALLQATVTEDQLRLIQKRISEHDVQLSGIYDAIENLLDEKAQRKSWEDRERIGFRKE